MQLQNKFCEKQNEGLIQEYEDRLKKTYLLIFMRNNLKCLSIKQMIQLVKE